MISCDFVCSEDLQLWRTIRFRQETPFFTESFNRSSGYFFYDSGGKRLKGLLEEKAVSVWIELYETLDPGIRSQFRKKPESFLGSGSIL